MANQQQRLDTERVISYVRTIKTGKFTTDQVAGKFKVNRGQAAACVAIMRIKNVVQRADPPTKEGSSHWAYTG